MTTFHLSYNQSGNRALRVIKEKPSLLVSYVYLKAFLGARSKFSYREWILDSGAFSAHNSGTEISLQEYIDTAKQLKQSDPTLSEVYALDVIGDWKASLKNCREMWRQGIEAIPCFHVGEPESVLKGLAKDFPKIALGGAVGYRQRDQWAAQCFNRVWPHKVHGFGFGSDASVMALPWHSVDASSWTSAPQRYMSWRIFGKMSIPCSQQDLRSQIIYYLGIESRAKQKWKPLFERVFNDRSETKLHRNRSRRASR